MSDYGIKARLIEKGIISGEDSILEEGLFLEFLFGIFLFYLSFERYKRLYEDAIENQRKSIIKNQKPKSFALPGYPFRFVGVGNETIFIGKMVTPRELFSEIVHENFFWNFNYIDRASPYVDPKIIEEESWKEHNCPKSYCNKYCEECKKDFSKFALTLDNNFWKSMGIESQVRIKLPVYLFKEIISPESLIELEQEIYTCSCNEVIEESHNFCNNCGLGVNKEIFEKEIHTEQPEKVFNEVLGLYLSLKKGYAYRANFVMDKDFINEVDIYLQKESIIKVIEYTTKLSVDKGYIITKIKNLTIIDNSLKSESIRQKKEAPHCSMILLGINQPDNLDYLEGLPLKVLDSRDKFKILKSNFKFNKTNLFHIDQPELNKLQTAFKESISTLADHL